MTELARACNLPTSQRFGGAAKAEPPGYYVNDKDGRPLKAYGTRFSAAAIYQVDLHKAIDQYGAIGTPLAAIADGTVAQIGTFNNGAKFIRVLFRGHTDSRYSFTHCDSFLVAVGAKVTKGQIIAKSGATGTRDSAGKLHPHLHLMIEIKEKGADGVTRWMSYDPARFYPARTFRFGSVYRAAQIEKGTCDAEGYLWGGTHVYSDAIYSPRPVTINPGANVRVGKDTTAAVLITTTATTPATQINEVPGGEYTIGGVKNTLWAKVKVPISGVLTTGYVAKPLIKVV